MNGNILRFTAGEGGAPNHIAQALLRSNLSINGLRTLSPLSDKAQVLVDRAVVDVGLERLVIAADVMAAGLTFPLTDPLSVTQVEWELISKTGSAQRTMSPSARGENQQPDRIIKRVPVYLTTDDFSVGIRTLRMSQRVGIPIDTTLVSQATRRVNEAIEDSFINGAATVGGYATPGLVNAPNANTQALTLSAWDASTVGDTILNETLAMIAKLQGDFKFGPYNMYVPTAVGNYLETDFKANGPLTIKQRLQQIEAGGRNLIIRTADQLPANTVVFMQMTNDVIDVVDGQAPTVIPWTSIDGFTLYWMVMAIQIPRVKTDYDGNSGICIGTIA